MGPPISITSSNGKDMGACWCWCWRGAFCWKDSEKEYRRVRGKRTKALIFARCVCPCAGTRTLLVFVILINNVCSITERGWPNFRTNPADVLQRVLYYHFSIPRATRYEICLPLVV